MDSEARSLARKVYFNEAAKNWDEKYYSPELVAHLNKLVPKFGLKAGQKVLDAGTGTGVLVPFLLRAIGPRGSITAIDYADNMVKAFREKFSNHRNVTVELKDVEELNLPSETFDAAVCFGLFPHLEHKEQALAHLNRTLKRGGRLIIAHTISSAEIREHHKASPPIAQDVLLEETEMRQMLERVGFVAVQVTDRPDYYLCLATKPHRRIQ